MTAKRFTINTLDGSIDLRDNNEVMTYKQVVDLLNELNDEKEILFDTVKKADDLINRFGSDELKHEWKKAVTIEYVM